jgi:hypothetical protein
LNTDVIPIILNLAASRLNSEALKNKRPQNFDENKWHEN